MVELNNKLPIRSQNISETLQIASKAMTDARNAGTSVRLHRSMASLRLQPHLVLHGLTLPLFFCALIWWAKAMLLQGWVSCIEFWMAQLRLPLHAALSSLPRSDIQLAWLYQERQTNPPSDDLMLITAVVLASLFGITFLLRDDRLPIKYLLRILCTIHALSFVFFWLWTTRFPYEATDHLGDMARMGYILLFTVPIMLAVGYYLLNFSLLTKLAFTTAVLFYFSILIPHKIVLHGLILHRGSVMYMPLLYICFGTILDVLIFVALYSWAISKLPQRAFD